MHGKYSVQIGSAVCDTHAVDVALNVKCLQLLYRVAQRERMFFK